MPEEVSSSYPPPKLPSLSSKGVVFAASEAWTVGEQCKEGGPCRLPVIFT